MMMKGKIPLMPSYLNFNNEKSIIKNPQCAVIIKDLSYFCNELHLTNLCSCYGQCMKVHICRSEADNNRSLLYAFVELSSEEAVVNLMEELNGVLFMGRQLRIQRCHDHIETRDVFSNKLEKTGIQILVRFQSIEDKTHGLVTEELLRLLFMDCGDIEDAIVQRHSQNGYRQKGYGFIFFLDINAAEHAVHAKNGLVYDNVRFHCELTHKAKERIGQVAMPEGSEGFQAPENYMGENQGGSFQPSEFGFPQRFDSVGNAQSGWDSRQQYGNNFNPSAYYGQQQNSNSFSGASQIIPPRASGFGHQSSPPSSYSSDYQSSYSGSNPSIIPDNSDLLRGNVNPQFQPNEETLRYPSSQPSGYNPQSFPYDASRENERSGYPKPPIVSSTSSGSLPPRGYNF